MYSRETGTGYRRFSYINQIFKMLKKDRSLILDGMIVKINAYLGYFMQNISLCEG